MNFGTVTTRNMSSKLTLNPPKTHRWIKSLICRSCIDQNLDDVAVMQLTRDPQRTFVLLVSGINPCAPDSKQPLDQGNIAVASCSNEVRVPQPVILAIDVKLAVV